MKNILQYPHDLSGAGAIAVVFKNPDENDSLSLIGGTQVFTTMTGVILTVVRGFTYGNSQRLVKQVLKLNYTDVDSNQFQQLRQLVYRACKAAGSKKCKYTDWNGAEYLVRFPVSNFDAVANARFNVLSDAYSFQLQLEVVS